MSSNVAQIFIVYATVIRSVNGNGCWFWTHAPYDALDLQMVNIGLRVLARPEQSELPTMYKQLGTDFDERVLPSIINEVRRLSQSLELSLQSGWAGSLPSYIDARCQKIILYWKKIG